MSIIRAQDYTVKGVRWITFNVLNDKEIHLATISTRNYNIEAVTWVDKSLPFSSSLVLFALNTVDKMLEELFKSLREDDEVSVC
jgi:hypothetical protein